jgi:hypothetical protein
MNKDVLEYTEQELRDMPLEHLQHLFNRAQSLEGLYGTQQNVEKVLINGLYGAMANKWFSLFNEDMAAAITANGRYFIRKLADYIEAKLQELHPAEKNYIIYGDTDSVYFQIEPFMQMYQEKNPNLEIDDYVNWADQFEQKVIKPVVQQCIDDFAQELNAFNVDAIGADREIIADCAVFTEKKKYYARVRDKEGTRYPEDKPWIKVMGLDVIKSTTPIWSKKYLNQAIPHILDKDEDDLRDWIRTIKDEFTTVNLNQIAIVGGISNLDYQVDEKGIPQGARSALRHNMYIKEHNLEDRIAPINAGDKCRKMFLIEPNILHTNVVSYTNDTFAKELEGIVDYDTQFQKGFLKPLELMTNCLGYNLEKETETLDEW